MRHRWPEDTRFTRLVLEVEDNVCAVCGGALHICDHRRHRIFTLQGPVEVVCKSMTSGKAGGLKKVEPLKAVRCCEPLKAVRL